MRLRPHGHRDNPHRAVCKARPPVLVFWSILYDEILCLPLPSGYCYPNICRRCAALSLAGSRMHIAAQRANEALAAIHRWSSTVNLRFNATKSFVLPIGKESTVHGLCLYLLGTDAIPFAQEIKFLGVTIDKQLSFASHIRETCKKATSAVCQFARVARADWGLPPRVFAKFWSCAIEPAILYAAPVWAKAAALEYNVRRLKTVQRTATLRIARAYRTTSHAALWTITGIMPIDLRIEQVSANYYALKGHQPTQHNYCPRFVNLIPFATLERRTSLFFWHSPSHTYRLSTV